MLELLIIIVTLVLDQASKIIAADWLAQCNLSFIRWRV